MAHILKGELGHFESTTPTECRTTSSGGVQPSEKYAPQYLTFVASHIHASSQFKSSQLEAINFSLLSDRDQRIALLEGEPPELTTTLRSSLELPTTLVLKHVDHANLFLQERLAESLQSQKVFRLGLWSVPPRPCG